MGRVFETRQNMDDSWVFYSDMDSSGIGWWLWT